MWMPAALESERAHKAVLVERSLAALTDGDALVWMDGDSIILDGARAAAQQKRFADYMALLADAPGGLLGFELIGSPLKHYAPPPLLMALDASLWLSNASLVSSAIFFLRASPAARRFCARWRRLAQAQPDWLRASGARGALSLFALCFRQAGGASLCAEIYNQDLPRACRLFYPHMGISVFHTPAVARLWEASGTIKAP